MIGKKISFGSLELGIAPTVYEPAEDSFLLATYASSLHGRILEIGCGSGIASLSAAKANPESRVVGVDTNPAAVECARQNAAKNGVSNASFLQSDLFDNVRGEFEAILFNPPYLPTTREERLADPEENAAYDGGESGLRALGRFAPLAPRHLAFGGRVAVIATSLSGGIEKACELLRANVGKTEILAEERFFFEKIALIEAVKTKNQHI